MIVTQIFGGAGNQMFQYAVGRRLSLDRCTQLLLDTQSYATDPSRQFALEHFRIAGKIATVCDLLFVLPWPRRNRRYHGLKVPQLWPRLTPRLRERDFSFQPEILNCPKRAYLSGLWQSEQYFASVAETIRADFQLREPLTATRQAIAQRIGENVAVSLHVRRGDYVATATNQALFGTCSPEWYDAAMHIMAETLDNPIFFVFSDDLSWARAHLPQDRPLHFVDPPRDGRDFEDMHLMSLCQHHIIANSTFSWWGAWLNRSPSKRVIAPARWFRDAPYNYKDIVPESWMRL